MTFPIQPARMHSPLVRLANAAGAPLQQMISLKPEVLLAEARKATGLDDFGGDEFRPALEILADSLEREGNFHFLGKVRTRGELLQCLINRLKIEEYFRRYPDTARVAIPDPIVIAGPPRTGSTFLHRLLSADPANRALRTWELRSPVPPGIRPAGPDDPRRATLRRRMAVRRKLLWSKSGFEILDSIHRVEADAPEECWPLLQNTFLSPAFFASPVDTFDRWLRVQDFTPTYRHYRRQLQIITAGRPAERLIVKYFGHLEHLDAFLRVFPNARVLCLQRAAEEMVPSVCALLASARVSRTKRIDPVAIGRTAIENTGWWMHKSIEARRLGPERCMAVHYRDLVADPLALVRRIYRFLGYPFEEQQNCVFEEHLARDRASRPRAVHKYPPQMFGLTAEGIRAAFRDYE